MPLASVSLEVAQGIHAAFDATVLGALDPTNAMAAKKSAGGTAPERITEQIAHVRARAAALSARAAEVPSLESLRDAIAAAPIGEA